MQCFQGRALVIGVNSYMHTDQLEQIPVAASDAEAVAEVLVDPQACSYPAEQVSLLCGEKASVSNIREALMRLTAKDASDTVLIYYSGHGKFDAAGQYHLTTSDTRIDGGAVVSGSGIAENELLKYLYHIRSQHLILLLNSCFAGAMSTRPHSTNTLSDDPVPLSVLDAVTGAREGLSLIAACRANQQSYYWRDEPTSLFARAVVEGLRGVGMRATRGHITLFDLYRFIYHHVTATAQERGHVQQPLLSARNLQGDINVGRYEYRRAAEGAAAPPLPRLPTGATRVVVPAQGERAFLKRLAPHILQLRGAQITSRDLPAAFQQLTQLELLSSDPLPAELANIQTHLRQAAYQHPRSRERERQALQRARQAVNAEIARRPWLHILLPAVDRLISAAGGSA